MSGVLDDMVASPVDDEQRFVTVAECNLRIQRAVSDSMLRIARAPRPFKLFGLNASTNYASRVAKHLGVSLTPHTERTFEDEEFYLKSGRDDSAEGNVRGHDVFVIQSIYADEKEAVATKFVKLCMMCGSLKDASAHEVVPIIPYLGWARQDRKTESRAPIMTKYLARMLESVGIDRALLFDVHNLAAEQNAFSVPIDNLEAKNPVAEWCARQLVAEGKTSNVKVLVPDSGGLNRAERFRNALLKYLRQMGVGLDDIDIAVFDKRRVEGKVKGGRIIGDVMDADVIAYDDMISTGSTMKKSCEAAISKEAGGRLFAICATHGLFVGKANEYFESLDTKIVVTDTVEPFRVNAANRPKLHVIDTTKMVADAIRKIHSGTGSISELLRT